MRSKTLEFRKMIKKSWILLWSPKKTLLNLFNNENISIICENTKLNNTNISILLELKNSVKSTPNSYMSESTFDFQSN